MEHLSLPRRLLRDWRARLDGLLTPDPRLLRVAPKRVDKGEIEILGLIVASFAYWRLLLAGLALGLIAGALILWICPRQYQASVYVVATDQLAPNGSSSGVDALVGSGVANLLSGGTTGTDPFTRFIQILGTETLAGAVLENHDLIHRIYAAEWSVKDARWHQAFSLRNLTMDAIYAIFGRTYWRPPDTLRLSGYLQKCLSVEADPPGSQQYHITFQSRDPELSRDVLTAVLAAANSLIKSLDIRSNQSNLAFLERQEPLGTYETNRAALTSLLVAEYRRQMLLSTSGPYAARSVIPVVLNPNPVGLTIIQTFILASFLGFAVAGFGALWLASQRLKNPVARSGVRLPAKAAE